LIDFRHFHVIFFSYWYPTINGMMFFGTVERCRSLGGATGRRAQRHHNRI